MTKDQKRLIAWFAIGVLLAMAWSMGGFQDTPFQTYDVHTILYACVVIAWGFLVWQRIVNKQVRRHLVAASVFMLFLFLTRLLRWRCFKGDALISEYAWYTYYLSFTSMPLCAFLAALCVGKEEKDQPLRRAKWLWLVQLAFSVIIFTNAWHELFFRYVDRANGEYDYGPVYPVFLAWAWGLSVMTIVIIIRRCRVSSVKKYWYVPFTGYFFFAGLILWYYACGGSPSVFGMKLYNLQEVVCLLFIFPFESMIQIGILPSNTRYELFFENSSVPVSLQDVSGKVAYASKTYAGEGLGENVRRMEKEIGGGKVVYHEDLSAIHKLDQEIQKVTEKLEEENDLIRRENEIRSERISYETKNRLYDKLAYTVRDKALLMDELLTKIATQAKGEEGLNKEKLARAMILGAYVKRRGNLMLIAEESKQISVKELGNAVRESLEYFGLTGATWDFEEKGERLLSKEVILLTQDLFESVLETKEQMESLLVLMDARDGFLFRMVFDGKEPPIDEHWRENEFAGAGIKLSVKNLGDVWRVNLLLEEDAKTGGAHPGKEGEE